MKTIVLYYSAGGSTEAAAKALAADFSADIERIDTLTPYPEDEEAMIALGQKEAETGATPAIKPLAHDLSEYDTVVIGTPTWWYTMAPAVLTLLKSYDFKGKTVLPFQTHVGQPGHVIPDMRKELKGSMLFSGLSLEYGKDKKLTPRSESEYKEWTAAVRKELKI